MELYRSLEIAPLVGAAKDGFALLACIQRCGRIEVLPDANDA
jgi:hypothetical protein